MTKKDKKKKINSTLSYINMPITSVEEDKIGIGQYAQEIKEVIDKGAQSIAITSDFGGGKSSLIRYLESEYNGLFTKFCYVNLWSHTEGRKPGESGDENGGECATSIHKSFIYQLASQISKRKGNFVSRRLSANYGMMGITLPSLWTIFLSGLLFVSIVLGLMCTTLYETVSPYFTLLEKIENPEQVGVAAFVLSGLFALILFYNTDIVFSSKNSESNRIIDEHELMDIYKTYICRFHLKHYIVVIEDLDRSDREIVKPFIKELRRYYVPCLRKRSKYKWLNSVLDFFAHRFNRITFIVNIKSENEIVVDEKDKYLYSKAFDYVLNLREVSMDNYDVILKKLLEDNKELCEKNNIPIWEIGGQFVSTWKEECNPIPAFEWIIRGKNIGVREIKSRLSNAFSIYMNLSTKFKDKPISLEKCIVAAYIMNAYEKEYAKIKEKGFDGLIDMRVSGVNMTVREVMDNYGQENGKYIISSAFANDIITLIQNEWISSDYKQYFYNYPKDSYLNSDKETQLINTILYDHEIKDEREFGKVISDVLNTNADVIYAAFSRLWRLGKLYPDCVFENIHLLNEAFYYNKSWFYTTLRDKYQYDMESIGSTTRILKNVLQYGHAIDAFEVEKICEIVMSKAEPRGIISVRREFAKEFPEKLSQFKSLYMGECPLITKIEMEALKEDIIWLELINLDSPELDMEAVENIHEYVLSGLDLHVEMVRNFVVKLYLSIYSIFENTEKKRLIEMLFEIMEKAECMISDLEELVLKNKSEEGVVERYIALLNKFEVPKGLSEKTLSVVTQMGISDGLSEELCLKLKDEGYYQAFVMNACNINIDLVDFEDGNVILAIEKIDLLDEKSSDMNDILFKIRGKALICKKNVLKQDYKYLFFEPYPMITDSELEVLYGRVDSIDVLESLEYIDRAQITEVTAPYVAEYLCKNIRSQTESYEILKFVGQITTTKAKYEIFKNLDFDKIQYYRISAERKKHIISMLVDCFDFTEVGDQIYYMTQTKCSHSAFEKDIKQAIATAKEDDGEDWNFDYEDAYVDYVKVVKKVTQEVINVLMSLRYYHAMPPHILEKLYQFKKYRYYVASKITYEKRFVYNKDENLIPAYKHIFLSEEGRYTNVKPLMAKNESFVGDMCQERLYVDTTEYTRMWFTGCMQSKECLEDLFTNYTNSFIIQYLCEIKGFKDREASEYFLKQIKGNSVVAASVPVYKHNHEKLVDGALKGVYTRYHKQARK